MPFVANSQRVWELYKLSKDYRCRPSDLLTITHPVQAFYLDRAVWTFGTSLDAALAKVEDGKKKAPQIKAAKTRVLHTWLEMGAQGFRAPTGPTRT